MISDNNYSFCQTKEETIAHFYFDCKYTSDIWKQILEWMNFSHTAKPLSEEMKWIMDYTTTKGWKAAL